MELLLIRHGLPRRTHATVGPADPSLDELGLRQAEALAAWLVDEDLDALYVSPLARARETAAPVEAALGMEATVRDGIAEWDREASAYIPTEDLPDVAPDIWEALAGGDWAALGIDLPEFLHRVTTSIDEIAAAHPAQRVGVVCHGGVINAYVARVLELDRVLFFNPEYTGITRLLVSRAGARSVRSLNETAHLRWVQPSGGSSGSAGGVPHTTVRAGGRRDSAASKAPRSNPGNRAR